MDFHWTYAVALKREEDGSVGAYAAAMPDAIAFGADEAEALAEMVQALDAAVRGRIQFGMDLEPPPAAVAAAEELHRITLAPALAAKATIYVLWRNSGLSKVALAKLLDVDEREARRVLDPDHPTGLDRLAAAADVFGHRLTVGAVPA
ncbi:hypothetical protein MKL09_23920 [Methylobacterium sp. J-048]|uniref:type II toxin-antitoxin system HicB family antitoxin n=1 Tax=Methylobacterium sp. J-048 TaxID=2836635 RepID=UPI001FBBAC66|nr:hypothetical protein [Methylobacterium sp. J-048]MCJ2059576.1 hypothetical protein [Methylobacterium sp. J-048]